MIFLYDNEIDGNTIIAKTCESGYPVSNLQDFQVVKKWRTTGTSSEWAMVDLGSTSIPINYTAIIGHNFSTGATITLQATSSSDFSSTETLSTSLSYSSGIMMQAITATTKRYVRWKINDTTDNSDGYVEFGRSFVGTKLEITAGAIPETAIGFRDTSIVKRSITGQIYGDEGVITQTFENISFPIISNIVRNQIETMYKDVKIVEPIFLDLYKDKSTDIKPLYCNFIDTPIFNHIENLEWETAMLSFEEAK